ncbi:MAG: hypothetical protein HY788_11445 [Deltaproteobacteria bacterium]|nr:hypothetical protein [Deltaproteobacteria bacterium]
MIRILSLLLATALLTAPAWASFPSEPPDWVNPSRIRVENSEADFYAWTDGGSVFVHVDPVFGSIPLDKNRLRYGEYDGVILLREQPITSIQDSSGTEFSGLVSGPATLLVVTDERYEKEVLLYQTSDSGYSWVYIQGSNSASILFQSGIWKSDQPEVNLFIQKYETGSCVVVLLYDHTYLAFLDSDYSNGIHCSNDVLMGGASIRLEFFDTVHGFLELNIPGRVSISGPVEMKYPDK